MVRIILGFVDGWNREIHQAIEERVLKEYWCSFPSDEDIDLTQRQKRTSDMRSFYYARISTTANLLIAAMAFVVAVVALIAACIPLFTKS